jgi:isochorismate synthase
LLDAEKARLCAFLDRGAKRLAAEKPLRFAERALARTLGPADTVVVTVPAPIAPAETFLDLANQQPSCFWDPGHGVAWAGVGAAHELRARGHERFAHLRTAAEHLAPRLAIHAPDGTVAPRPRFFGGIAFDTGAADHAPWDEFGDASFVLPRMVYRTSAEGACLSLAVRGDELGNRKLRGRWLDKLAHALAELAGPVYTSRIADHPTAGTGIEVLEQPSLKEWSALVEAIGRGIADGRFTKIVAARRSRVAVLAPLTATDVLRRLAGPPDAPPHHALAPGVTRFVFGRARSAFVGATPERLVACSGQEFRTEALAGTARRGDAESLRALEGAKIGVEHRIVVDEITRRLAPLSASLEVASAPEQRVLRDIVHMRTPIQGRLNAPRHVLDLAAALHPTPAVGGVPSQGALAWIAARERAPRGWYAAPVGWFDTAGDGELAVALRCCVLRGAEAHLYAGAGIVAGSDPVDEFHEAALKERTLLRALGG